MNLRSNIGVAIFCIAVLALTKSCDPEVKHDCVRCVGAEREYCTEGTTIGTVYECERVEPCDAERPHVAPTGVSL